MIVYPYNWQQNYKKLSSFYFDPREINKVKYAVLDGMVSLKKTKWSDQDK